MNNGKVSGMSKLFTNRMWADSFNLFLKNPQLSPRELTSFNLAKYWKC
jgi:hypothetical protein